MQPFGLLSSSLSPRFSLDCPWSIIRRRSKTLWGGSWLRPHSSASTLHPRGLRDCAGMCLPYQCRAIVAQLLEGVQDRDLGLTRTMLRLSSSIIRTVLQPLKLPQRSAARSFSRSLRKSARCQGSRPRVSQTILRWARIASWTNGPHKERRLLPARFRPSCLCCDAGLLPCEGNSA